ncbi:hypothetical protein [Pseudomonas sp. NMS19W]|uniref:hypothetical protein n=1 Tax=Pseudomonas sp. NMS19W TaxID=3079768 RepID=UPI003F6556C3
MPYSITIAGNIHHCFPDFETARSDVLELRSQGHKPRLYVSTTFECLGCEIDDVGERIPDYTHTAWSDFANLLPNFDSAWSIEDDDLLNSAYRFVDVFVLLNGHTFHLADMRYTRGEEFPDHLLVKTHLLRVLQDLMDPNEL